jgi:hypothetical protein
MRRSRLPGPQAQRACLFQWVLVSPGLKTSTRAFLHLRFCVLTPRAIKNEYLRNTLDVRDGADELHRSRYLKSVALEALFSPKRLRGSFLSRKRDRPAKLNSMTAAPQSPGRSRAVAVGTCVSSHAPRPDPYVRLSRIRLPPRVCDGTSCRIRSSAFDTRAWF